jgi:hypothetical protein
MAWLGAGRGPTTTALTPLARGQGQGVGCTPLFSLSLSPRAPRTNRHTPRTHIAAGRGGRADRDGGLGESERHGFRWGFWQRRKRNESEGPPLSCASAHSQKKSAGAAARRSLSPLSQSKPCLPSGRGTPPRPPHLPASHPPPGPRSSAAARRAAQRAALRRARHRQRRRPNPLLPQLLRLRRPKRPSCPPCRPAGVAPVRAAAAVVVSK